MLRRALFALLTLAAFAGTAAAQSPYPPGPPPAVPALPDSQRQTTYTISTSTCACAVNFQLYGSGTDYQDWVEVWLNGIKVASNDATYGWSLSSATGNFAIIPRPITDAVLTFNNAQTGTVIIVGAERPRRLSTFSENQGVPARALNQTYNDLYAIAREVWDKINDFTGRGLFFAPGNTTGPMPQPSACQGELLGFDATGLNPVCVPPNNSGSGVVGAGTTGEVAVYPSSGNAIAGLPLGSGLTSSGSLKLSRGFGVMYPNAVQTASPTSAWNAFDPYGNPINCSSTQTQCAQEFINASVQGGWPAKIYGTGVSYMVQTGTLNSTTTVSGLTTSVLTSGGIVTGLGIPSGTTFTIASGSTITLSHAATITGSSKLAFPASLRTPLLLNNTLVLGPSQNWTLEARDIQFAGEPGLSNGVIFIDSAENTHIDLEGTFTSWTPSTLQGACVITIEPTNPTPFDNILGITASEFYLGAVAAGNALGMVCLAAQNGGIGTSTFTAEELYGANTVTNGLYLNGASTTSHIEANVFRMPYIHAFTSTGVWVAAGGGTPGFYIRNKFDVGIAPGGTSTICMSLNGSINWINGTCSDAEAGGAVANGLVFASGTSANHYSWIATGITTPKTDNGSNPNGWVN